MYDQEVKIKDFYGKIIATVETNSRTGDKRIRDFYGKILGTYDAGLDVTRDFYGAIVAKGDALTMLINK